MLIMFLTIPISMLLAREMNMFCSLLVICGNLYSIRYKTKSIVSISFLESLNLYSQACTRTLDSEVICYKVTA